MTDVPAAACTTYSLLCELRSWNWGSIVFWGLVLSSVFTLKRFERKNPSFSLVQLISGPDGKADKYSLAFCVVLFIGGWGIWYQAISPTGISEWLWTSYIGAFVLGAVAKTAAGVTERVKTLQTMTPPPAPPGDNIEQQVLVSPSVDDGTRKDS